MAPHFFGALILSIGDPFASVAAERNSGQPELFYGTLTARVCVRALRGQVSAWFSNARRTAVAIFFAIIRIFIFIHKIQVIENTAV